LHPSYEREREGIVANSDRDLNLEQEYIAL